MDTTSDAVRDRAIRLFSYLKELSELRTRMVRTVDSYERIIWLSDIPQFPGCFTAAWFDQATQDREEVWIEIQKPPVLQDAPTPPDQLADWLDVHHVADSSLDFPPLRESIERVQDQPAEDDGEIAEQGASDTPILLSDHPGVVEVWEAFVEEDWLLGAKMIGYAAPCTQRTQSCSRFTRDNRDWASSSRLCLHLVC